MSDLPRRIIVFLDGTWNADDGNSRPTNIVRMREALKTGVDARRTAPPAASNTFACGSAVSSQVGQNFEYIVYYDSGVGTGALDRLPGGIMGRGLDDNIRQAYRFLSRHYRVGDEIHVFGFSRGAFTARSVVGYLYSTGLLTPESGTTEREEQAWRYYRTSPDDRNCGDWYKLKDYLHPADKLTVKSVGVFDTVGALGIPLDLFRSLNAQRYAFHNTELSPIVEYSFHAVAIDEHRRAFEATLWRKPKFKTYLHAAKVEQVWFPGAHADIGGGYTNWDAWDPRDIGRQDIAYDWMIRRLRDCVGLDFAASADTGAPAQRCTPQDAVQAEIHRPWGKLDSFRKTAVRIVDQVWPLARAGSVAVGIARHEDAIGEKIHISALDLLAADGVSWEGRRGRQPYRPANLLAVLPLIAAHYQAWNPQAWAVWRPYARALAKGAVQQPTLPVIGWDGHEIPATPNGQTHPDIFARIGANPTIYGLPIPPQVATEPERETVEG